MLVDSHCHLDFPELQSQLPEVLIRTKEHGVGMMQTICTRISQFDKIYDIAKAHPQIYASIGNHPNHVAEEPEVSAEDIIAACKGHEKIIGIGETGLDYYYDYATPQAQQKSFDIHIEAAQEIGLPVIVHTRDADDDTIMMLERAMKQKVFPGLIHCFSTSEKLAQAAVEMGLYISISGIVTFKKADELREAVSRLPLGRLLVETDAPYLAPVPHRGKTNEPGFTRYAAEKIAEIKGVSLEEVAVDATDNFFRLFSRADRSKMVA